MFNLQLTIVTPYEGGETSPLTLVSLIDGSMTDEYVYYINLLLKTYWIKTNK